MDSFVLKKVVEELRGVALGSLVSKVHQPGKREIVLDLWKPGGGVKVMISAHPTLCSVHITSRSLANPPSPPRFCQALRKHLSGVRLTSVDFREFERYVRLGFSGKGFEGEISLVCELFGRHSNVILVGPDGIVINALNLVTRDSSTVREVVSGVPYSPLPPLPKVLVSDVTVDDCREILREAWDDLPSSILKKVHGLSKELLSGVSFPGEPTPEELYEELNKLVEAYRRGSYVVGLVRRGEKIRLLPLVDGWEPPEGFEDFDSPSAAADEYFYTSYTREQFGSARSTLTQAIRKRLKKARRKLDNVLADVEKLKEYEEYGKLGELLKSALHRMKRGDREVTVVDYFADPPVERAVPLDPSLSPVENMNRYFRLYRKGQTGMEVKARIIPAVEGDIEYLESVLYYAERARSMEELVELREELIASGFLRDRESKKKKKKRDKGKARREPPAVERRRIGDFPVYVGKSNRGNDHILRHMASPDDLWLHARHHPGSHVLLKVPRGKEVPEEVLIQAAKLAAARSAASEDSKVEVYVAKVRDLARVPGNRPGLVRVRKYNTLLVEPADW